MQVYLTAILKSRPGQEANLLSVLQQMVVHSRQEPGCLRYELQQSAEDPLLFIFHEIWADQNALAHHNEQPYIQAFARSAPGLLQEPPVIYQARLLA